MGRASNRKKARRFGRIEPPRIDKRRFIVARPNLRLGKYADGKPSEQKNTSGQRRMRREPARHA